VCACRETRYLVSGAFLSSKTGNLAGRTGLPILRHSFGFHLEVVFGSNSVKYSPLSFVSYFAMLLSSGYGLFIRELSSTGGHLDKHETENNYAIRRDI